MTPDQELAADRVRRTIANENTIAIYNTHAKPSWHKGEWGRADQLDWAQEKYNNDCEQLARAFLADHPADEDEPVTLADLESAGLHEPEFPAIERDGKLFGWVCGYVEIKTRRRLRALLEGLGVEHG